MGAHIRCIYYLPIGDTARGRRTWMGLFVRRLDATAPRILADVERLSALGIVEPHGMNYGLLNLSPQGTMLAIAAGSNANTSGTLRVYKMNPDGELNIDQPLHTFDTDVVSALDWAPNEQSLATISLWPEKLSIPLSGDQINISVQVVPLDGEAQQTIGSFKIPADPAWLDMLCFKTLSWTH
jgi:WD40 repeat protein